MPRHYHKRKVNPTLYLSHQKRYKKAYRATLRGGVASRLIKSRIYAKRGQYVPCLATIDEVVSAFNGKCHACRTKGTLRTLRIDHCHKTGKFRGWLCNDCNTALGRVGDSAKTLKRLVEYLHGR